IDRDAKPHSAALEGWRISLDVQVVRDTLPLKNVVGVLEGHGPLAKETVVVGAHYDHLGYGSEVASLAVTNDGLKKPAIHHGADDNGSGTTAVIEMARRLPADPNRHGRR